MIQAKQNSDLQCLRAIAILLVVAQHAFGNLLYWQSDSLNQIKGYFDGGTGVDLFLVISGFIITQSLWPQLTQAMQDKTERKVLFKFWIKRIWRLLPSAWLWLFLPLMMVLFFNSSGAFGAFKPAWEGALAALLNIANIRFGDCFLNYDCGPFAIYWSLSLEEQFYIALPLLIIAARGALKPLLLIFLATQLLIPALWLPFIFRIDGLVLGVLLALISQQSRDAFEPRFLRSALARTFFVMTCIVLLGSLLAPSLSITPSAISGFKIAAIIGVALVFAASFNAGYIANSTFLTQVLSYIGDRSYTLYLTHIPAYLITREIFFRTQGHLDTVPVALYISSALAILWVITELSYRLIEIPLRNHGRRIVAETQ